MTYLERCDKILVGETMDREEAIEEFHKINMEMIREELGVGSEDDIVVKSAVPSEHECLCHCKKKQKRKDKYKDIIDYIEMYVKWALMSKEPNVTIGEINPLYKKIQEWLEEEV